MAQIYRKPSGLSIFFLFCCFSSSFLLLLFFSVFFNKSRHLHNDIQRSAGTESAVTFNATTPCRRRKGRHLRIESAETTSFSATTPRQHRESRQLRIEMAPKPLLLASRHVHCKGRHLRIEMMPKLLVLAPRRPASTARFVTYKSQWCQKLVSTPQHPASLQRSALAEPTSFNTTTPGVHCKGRHLRIRIVPKLLLLASRHPASTVKVVTFATLVSVRMSNSVHH